MRAGIPMERTCEYQGTYDVMGCSERCSEQTWDGLPHIHKILEHINHDTFECSEEGLPRCPYCGALAELVFRHENFEKEDFRRYADFVESSADKRLCILELGVGFNMPVVIRWPFEKYIRVFPKAKLFRVSRGYAGYRDHPAYYQVPEDLQGRAFSIHADAGEAIHALGAPVAEAN